ncbi:MAG: response regulator [Mongoliitalea sp.]
MDNTSDATQVSLENGNLFYINEEASKRLGIDKEEACNYYVWDFEEVFKDQSVWHAHVQELKQIPHMIMEGTNVHQQSGERFPVEVTVKHLSIEGIGYIVATSRDISERKKIEDELVYTNVYLKRAMNMAKMGSWELDLETRELKWTENLYRIHELSEKNGMDLERAFSFYSKKDQVIIQKISEQVIATGKEAEFVGKIYLKNDTFKWVKLKILLIREEGTSNKLIGLTQDITDQQLVKEEIDKQIELQTLMIDISSTYINTKIEDLSKTINESLSRISQFVKADRGYVFDYNFIENTASNTYEWCAEGVPAEIENLQNLPIEFIPAWVEQHQNSQTFEVPDIATLENENLKSIIEPQGIKTLVTFPMLHEGNLIGFVGFDWVHEVHKFQDAEKKLLKIFGELLVSVTTKSALERSLILAKEEAEKSNKAKSEFLANMSHEIRTPLNGVIGFTDLLINTDLSEVQLQYVQSANSSAHSLLGIINDILDFSKIEAGKLELEEIEADIVELIEQTADIVKFNTSSKDLEFLLNIQIDMPRYLVVDAIRLKQILVNLLSNAIKFTERGEVELIVKFKESPTKQGIGLFTFSVRDTGIGISEEQQEKLFKSFSQADSSTTRKFGGTGLGLVISQMLAEKMDSQIELNSEVGKGSTFHFTIERPFQTSATTKTKEFTSIKKILLVDDNTNNRNILRDILNHWKIETDEVDNGLSALQILSEAKKYDILIVDYHMPYMDGLTTIGEAKKIISTFKGKKPKILLYSSVDEVQNDERYKSLNIDAKLIKPAKISELFNCLLSLADDQESISRQKNKSTTPADLHGDEPIKILIAEDVSLNMILLKTILMAHFPKAEIIEAQNGQEAIESFEVHQPNLIFMDVQMPIKDGFEATRGIREIEGNSGTQTPIIALTAGALQSEKEACLAAGMNYFMTKPLEKQKILDLVKQIFKRVESDDSPLRKEEFDYESLLEMLANDAELLRSIMHQGFAEIEESLEKLCKVVMADEKEKLNLLHKLKGLTGSLCMTEFSQSIRAIEEMENPIMTIAASKKALASFKDLKRKIEEKLL